MSRPPSRPRSCPRTFRWTLSTRTATSSSSTRRPAWSSTRERVCGRARGRTHQIRVHLSHLGPPVVGDATYGGGAKKALSLPPADRRLAGQLVMDLGRQALHASTLEFRHPTRGETMRFHAPLPNDLARAL